MLDKFYFYLFRLLAKNPVRRFHFQIFHIMGCLAFISSARKHFKRGSRKKFVAENIISCFEQLYYCLMAKHIYEVCALCGSFVGISEDGDGCPCKVLGKHEAIKRTWLALEAGGWLDDTTHHISGCTYPGESDGRGNCSGCGGKL